MNVVVLYAYECGSSVCVCDTVECMCEMKPSSFAIATMKPRIDDLQMG
jgi:hypothetical protein